MYSSDTKKAAHMKIYFNLKHFTAKCILFFSAAMQLFAYEGMMAGEKDLRIVCTEHFEIIFPERSRKSAEIIFDGAEKVYKEVAESYNLRHDFKMPVVISPSQDEFNGYFSFAPFNHIVIHDTVPSEDMAVFSESLISVFRHELTHAISYNVQGDFWNGVKKSLGDSYNPGILFTTTSWAEGAAVSSESSGGEGRLNDEFSLHFLKQAKVEGRFPRYSEINGTKDVYPYTRQSYYFGGAFSAWLQKKYGMEKYAEFWYKCVNFRTLTYFMCFKQVYGIPIKNAWNDFYQDVQIPEIPSSPLENQYCTAFDFHPSNCLSLTSCKNGFAYYDAYSSSVYFVKNGGKKTIRLFKMPSVSKVGLTYDGRYAAVSYTSSAGRNAKHKVRIYDIKRRRFFTIKESGLRDASIFSCGGEYYAAAVHTENQNTSLKIYSLKTGKNGGIYETDCIAVIKNDMQKFVFSPAGNENGIVYFIYKDGMNFSIRGYNIFSKNMTEFRLPYERAVIRNLNALSDGGVSFSWTKPHSMPRLGLLSTDNAESTGTFILQKDDCSGGIFSPAYVGEKRFIYIGSFFDGTKLLFADMEKMNLERMECSSFDMTETSAQENLTSAENLALQAQAIPHFADEKPFSLVKYGFTHKGTVLPFALTSTSSITGNAQTTAATQLPIGITYVSASPWTSPIWGVSAGYSILTNSGAVGALATGGTKTELFKYVLRGQIEFDRYGYKQTTESAEASCKIPFSNTEYIKFSNKFNFFEGRQTLTQLPAEKDNESLADIFSFNIFGMLENGNLTKRIFTSDGAAVAFGNISKCGREHYEYSGAEIALFYDTHYCAPLTELDSPYSAQQNLGLTGTVKIPRILPVKNVEGFTNNLPLSVQAALFPAQGYYAAAKTDVILFAKEIQWAPNILPLLYTNRFALSTYYLSKLSSGTDSDKEAANTIEFIRNSMGGSPNYSDELAFKAELTLTPNISGAANYSFSFKLNTVFKYRPNPEENQNAFALTFSGITIF